MERQSDKKERIDKNEKERDKNEKERDKRRETRRGAEDLPNTPGLHYLPITQLCTPIRGSLGTNFSAFILSSLEQHARGQGLSHSNTQN